MKHLIYELNLQEFDHRRPSQGLEETLPALEREVAAMSRDLMEQIPACCHSQLRKLEEKHVELGWRHGLDDFADGFALGVKLMMGVMG